MRDIQAILAPLTIVLGGIGLTLPAFRKRSDGGPSLCAGLTIGVGIWAVCQGIGMLMFGGRTPASAVAAESCVVVIGGIFIVRFGKSHIGIGSGIRDFTAPRVWPLTLVLLLMIAVWAGAAAVQSQWRPDGDWDAWALWNVRARFLYRGGNDLAAVFSPVLGHADYPPLVPVVICSIWRIIGREIIAVPAVVAGGFACLVLGVLIGGLRRMRGPAVGLLAGIVLLGTPFFLNQAEDQMADVPLSLFLLTACLFLSEGLNAPKQPAACFALAGLAASLGAATKNEGTLHVAALGLTLLVCTSRGRAADFPHSPRPGPFASTACFALGALPVMVLLGWFKHVHAPPNDLVAGTTPASALNHVLDLSRYWKIGRAMGLSVVQLGRWNCYGIAMLAVWLVMLWRRQVTFEAGAIALAATLIFLGYCVVYLLEPHDLNWILTTSFDRLVLQIWPSMILATGLLWRGHLPFKS